MKISFEKDSVTRYAVIFSIVMISMAVFSVASSVGGEKGIAKTMDDGDITETILAGYPTKNRMSDDNSAFISNGFDSSRLPDQSAEACGAPIEAVDGGFVTEVVMSRSTGGKGNYIKIEGVRNREYIHIDRAVVGIGDEISKGDIIAYAGKSGLSGYNYCVREIK